VKPSLEAIELGGYEAGGCPLWLGRRSAKAAHDLVVDLIRANKRGSIALLYNVTRVLELEEPQENARAAFGSFTGNELPLTLTVKRKQNLLHSPKGFAS
jgi:hypothetical protein